MSQVRFIIIVLICASPLILLWDGLVTQGLISGILAISLLITAFALRPGETEFLLSIVRLPIAVAAVPVLWIIWQILPLHVLAHPIWSSAETALGQRLAATISIDPGLSALSLGQYLMLAAAAFLAAAIAVDRGRAEGLLFALTAATSMIALIVCGLNFLDFLSPPPRFSPSTYDQAGTCAAMGAIIATAACLRCIERYETRHTAPGRSVPNLIGTLIACAAGLLLCLLALVFDRALLVGTACGLGTLACITIIRRLGLGPWGMAAVAIPALGAALLLVALQPIAHGRSLLLASAAADASPATVGVTERVLDDAPLFGTGAGTFSAIAPVYREIGDPSSESLISTTAANLAIELGRPMLWYAVIATLALLIFLLRASVQRGRDSFYPAMGAGCLVTLLLGGFVNTGLLGNASGLIAASVVGLALIQSKSRTAQLI